MARELGISEKAVTLRLNKAGVEPLFTQRKSVTAEEIREMRRQGMSVADVARALGCSEGLVYKRLHRDSG